MKSLQVANVDAANAANYSDLKVMKSGAGFYVGTSYTNKEDLDFTFEEPGSRDSEYFATKEEAAKCLDHFENGDYSKYRPYP